MEVYAAVGHCTLSSSTRMCGAFLASCARAGPVAKHTTRHARRKSRGNFFMFVSFSRSGRGQGCVVILRVEDLPDYSPKNSKLPRSAAKLLMSAAKTTSLHN